MTITKQLAPKEAREAGYVPVTFGYRVTSEGHQLENALRLMRRGGADHAVVCNETTGHPEIWRKFSETRGIAK